MFTPFDTAHLTHRAARHHSVSEATREANRQLRSARGAARRAWAVRVFGPMLGWAVPAVAQGLRPAVIGVQQRGPADQR